MQKLPTRQPKNLTLSPSLFTMVSFFAAGICWAEPRSLNNQFIIYIILLLAGFIVLLCRYKTKIHNLIFHILLGFLFFLNGCYAIQSRLTPPAVPNHIFNLVKKQQTLSLYGTLLECPSVTNSTPVPKTRLTMQAEAIYRNQASGFYPVGSIKTSGLVQLTLNGLLPGDLKPGDHFLAKAKVSRIFTFSTPGSFNYKKHLANKSILIKGWVGSQSDIIKIDSVNPRKIFFNGSSLRSFPQRIRSNITIFLDDTLSQPAKGLYKAILIGERSDVEPSVLENFISSGCIHILAISGMHMGLLAFVSIAVLTWLLKRSTWLLLQTNVLKVAVVLSLVPLIFYAFIAGMNLPVLRSLLMTSVFILAFVLDRPGNLINHILIAALLILAWKPTAILTASFQLSFSAVIAIAFIYPLLVSVQPQSSLYDTQNISEINSAERIKLILSVKIIQWLFAGITVTVAAMAGTLPLLLFHFNRISLVAPLTNLLVEPLICFWSLIIGIAACPFIPVFPFFAKLLLKTGSLGLMGAAGICAYSSSLPHASARLPTPSVPEIILYYIFILSIAMSFHLRNARRRFSIASACLAFFFLLAVPVVSEISRWISPETSVSILDVGHGSSTLVQMPYGKEILIDGGGSGNEDFNIGERVIGPFLWNQQIDHLDAVVVSHPHADHYNGLPFIIRYFHPEELWINGMTDNDPQYRQLLHLARSLNIAIRIPKDDEVLFRSGSAQLQCVHNGMLVDNISGNIHFSVHTEKPDINDTSLVLRLDTRDNSFLFPADISSTKAETLIADGKNLRAEILLAPHHGSRSSMSPDFIKAVSPKFIAISVGRNNPFDLPDMSFRSLSKKGIHVYTTELDGTLTFKEENSKMIISRYQIN